MNHSICIATSTRADWGLLKPLATALRQNPAIRLQILATNMHLLPRYGHTIDEITGDGFTVDATVAMDDSADDSPKARAEAMAQCLSGTAHELARLQPDALVILGDRYEMLAVASAATLMRVPIIHIAGGEITLGAIDDSIRHAITKLASLHLTATEPYRRRVIQMGEAPDTVICTGAIGVWNVFQQPFPTETELRNELNINGEADLAVVTYHPATCDDAEPTERFAALLAALDRFPQLHCIITYPNNDPRSMGIINLIEGYAKAHPQRVTAIKSLGMRRYLAAITAAKVVIGNSSSGLVEVPSAGTPTVDIGIRQAGRLAGESVIHCNEGTDAIAAAINRALSPQMQALAARRVNPYAKANTLEIMEKAVLNFVASLPHKPKQFYDIDFTC
ncbi:MAG: UDP-N-acetylglucosamine 2-epimerase [Muribaculaceae bacterium]